MKEERASTGPTLELSRRTAAAVMRRKKKMCSNRGVCLCVGLGVQALLRCVGSSLLQLVLVWCVRVWLSRPFATSLVGCVVQLMHRRGVHACMPVCVHCAWRACSIDWVQKGDDVCNTVREVGCMVGGVCAGHCAELKL